MRYFSTRNKEIYVSPSEAIIQGISKEGGLFVPESLPKIKNLGLLKDMDYKNLAFEIMSLFFTDFEPASLRKCVDNAYDKKFTTKEIAPLKEVDGVFFLELYHGPTLAFKDMALSILPHLLKEAMRIQGVNKEVVILTATSGDTGKAALEGFANVEGIKIIVFYPENGVSQIQERQMITQRGDNTFVVAIKGNFDDAQTGVKQIFNDLDFRKLLEENNYTFSSANSINIGRLVPQIVYYFHSYLILLREGKIKDGEQINIVVPTGNFGNILAAYYGKLMGLPIGKLICASNDNKVLTDFFNTGTYDRRRDLVLTTSPSMDILVSSNLERLLYHLSGEDIDLVKALMEQLNQEGYYRVEGMDTDNFYAGYSDEGQVAETIRKLFFESNYLMDTHTAVAYRVYEEYKNETGDHTKTVIASTASPFKFGEAVAMAIGLDIKNKDEFAIIEDLAQATGTRVPKAIGELKSSEILHYNRCEIDEMKDLISGFLKVGEFND